MRLKTKILHSENIIKLDHKDMSKHLTAFFMLLCITSLFISPATYAKSKERLGINQQGIKVWTYQTKDNPMLEYRAETAWTKT